jgi:hypothetical protein
MLAMDTGEQLAAEIIDAIRSGRDVWVFDQILQGPDRYSVSASAKLPSACQQRRAMLLTRALSSGRWIRIACIFLKASKPLQTQPYSKRWVFKISVWPPQVPEPHTQLPTIQS